PASPSRPRRTLPTRRSSDLFQQQQGAGRLILADGHLKDGMLLHLTDGGLHVAVEEQLAALDDADLVADVGQLRQDMARYEDRLSLEEHTSEVQSRGHLVSRF